LAFGIAKAVVKKQTVSLSAGGLSKAPVTKAKKTTIDLMAGLATILHPGNLQQLQSMICHDQAAQMHPNDPHSSNSNTVLLRCVQTSDIQVPEIAATKVTMDIMSNDEEPGTVAFQSDLEASNPSKRQAKKTSHL
jgi:hypothetical protein